MHVRPNALSCACAYAVIKPHNESIISRFEAFVGSLIVIKKKIPYPSLPARHLYNMYALV